jgi:hypothetical protein
MEISRFEMESGSIESEIGECCGFKIGVFGMVSEIPKTFQIAGVE